MGLNQAQMVGPRSEPQRQQKEKKDPLDTILQGLQIANGALGIGVNLTTIQKHMAEKAAMDDARNGVLTKKEALTAQANGMEPVAQGTPGALNYKIRTGEGDNDYEPQAFMLRNKQASPLLETVKTYAADGKTPVFKTIEKKPGQEIPAYQEPKAPPAPKDVKTRAVTFTDPKTGEEVTQIVEDKPGLEIRGGQKPKPVTPDQSKAALFAKRMEQAEGVFTALEKDGYSRADRAQGAASLAPDVMKPEALKRQEQAEKNFLTAVLRRESGASISPSEFSTAEAQYFPRAGDPPDLLEQKRQNRQLALQGLAAEAGPDALAAIKLPAQKTEKKVESGTAYAAGAPKVGEVMDGYKFKGGDPADPKNWEPVDDTPDRPIDTGGRRR